MKYLIFILLMLSTISTLAMDITKQSDSPTQNTNVEGEPQIAFPPLKDLKSLLPLAKIIFKYHPNLASKLEGSPTYGREWRLEFFIVKTNLLPQKDDITVYFDRDFPMPSKDFDTKYLLEKITAILPIAPISQKSSNTTKLNTLYFKHTFFWTIIVDLAKEGENPKKYHVLLFQSEQNPSSFNIIEIFQNTDEDKDWYLKVLNGWEATFAYLPLLLTKHQVLELPEDLQKFIHRIKQFYDFRDFQFNDFLYHEWLTPSHVKLDLSAAQKLTAPAPGHKTSPLFRKTVSLLRKGAFVPLPSKNLSFKPSALRLERTQIAASLKLFPEVEKTIAGDSVAKRFNDEREILFYEEFKLLSRFTYSYLLHIALSANLATSHEKSAVANRLYYKNSYLWTIPFVNEKEKFVIVLWQDEEKTSSFTILRVMQIGDEYNKFLNDWESAFAEMIRMEKIEPFFSFYKKIFTGSQDKL